MNNFWQRTMSGTIYVLLIISACMFHFYQWVFIGIVALALEEWMRITTGAANFRGRVIAALGGAAVYSTLLVGPDFLGPFLAVLLFVFFLSFMMEVFSAGGKLHNLAFLLAGYVYILVPFCLVIFLGREWSDTSSQGSTLILCLFILIWTNDTFAYLTGKLIGRTPAFSGLSPKKTLEGYLGGLAFTMLGAYIFGKFNPEMPMGHLLTLGAIVSIFANTGDLAESFIKRQLGIKDSGRIMPGHGGVLDRFDSFLFVIPAVSLYMIFYRDLLA